jgi:hypothetical protein
MLAGGLGGGQAKFLAAADPALVPDLAFKLSAATALPLPLAALAWLSQPPHAALRRQLGETDRARLGRSRRTLGGLALVVLLAPLGLALAWPTDAGLRAALLSATAVLTTASLSVVAVLLALQAMARQQGALAALTGGGAFGPAAAAPLLYAPAFGLVAAMVPVAVLSALWAAAPDVATVPVLAGALLLAALSGGAAVIRHSQQSVPLLAAAWLAVEQAHATPWRDDAPLPQPGPGLRGIRSPLGHLLALAWVRRWPGSAWASTGLALLGLWWTQQGRPSWWWLWSTGAAALYGVLRAGAVEREGALAAAAWLGARRRADQRALARLGLGLAWPSLALLLAALWHREAWPWIAIAVVVGSAVGALLLGRSPARWRPWLGLLALVLWLAAMGA